MNNQMKKLAAEVKRARARDVAFMNKMIGKWFLKKALELTNDWATIMKVFCLSQRRLEKYLAQHHISKPRPPVPRHSWPDKIWVIVEDYYSRPVQNKIESIKLSREMESVVNQARRKAGLYPVSLGAIRTSASQRGLVWGWTPRCVSWAEKESIIKAAVAKSKKVKTDEEFDKLIKETARRLKSTEPTVIRLACDFGLRWGYKKKKLSVAPDAGVIEDKRWLASLRKK